MRLKLALSATFLGLLVAFMGWSLQWALDARQEVTFDMPGDVTTLKLYDGPQDVSDADANAALQELKNYARDHSLSLIVASPGDGYPEMIVYDPAGRLSWFSAATDDTGSDSSVHIFEGTYSERRWTASSVTPLLPPGTPVAGVVAPPAGAGNLQYVRSLGAVALPPGDYVLSTTSSDELAHLEEFLGRQGLAVQESRQIPLLPYLTHDPLVVVTSLFLLLGHVCAATYWSVLLGARTRELVIRRRHGARRRTLVRRWFANGLPGVASGIALGVAVSGLVVRAVGREALAPPQYLTLVEAAAVGLALTSTVWLVTLSAVVRSRDGVSRAA